jgi:GxxExxY protein
MEVLNALGHGLHEKHYERALAVEFALREIPHRQQERFPVHYKGVMVGVFVPDLLAFDQIVVEVKTVDQITDHERGQVLNYLRITGLRLGLLLNFKHARLEWERLIV